jgi:alpha-tubulin suppressor-like RCC1 family protein
VGLYVGYGEQCARTKDGSLSCWGIMSAPGLHSGELNATRWEASSGGVSQVAIGNSHACALLAERTLWCWGANDQGQLGTGDPAQRQAPIQLTALGQEVVSVAAGAYHTCATLRDGSVRCWGRSEYGALGLGQTVSSPTPAPVPGLEEVVRVAAGYQKTCAWKKDGSVWCFGELLRDAPPQALAMMPVEMKELGRQVEEVAFGFRHTCARTATPEGAKGGDVYCWGERADGKLGGGSLEDTSGVVRVSSLSGKALSVAAGDYFACAVTVDGSAWCWGSGFEGQLGTGHKGSSPRPVRVQLPLTRPRTGVLSPCRASR